ncbi:hypothetical protein CAPTEDRAFT_97456 [Capitella teleta]|uniref:Uncharacterized protein n=2 Tax=Capitella teleta TaxID=283909 RepID=R7U2A3_CAPTE|nr:hypothetical protein CAPTEDRAFT_97456 [Capitella teleta]|eukprot:ELU00130.1 hypothetical protein CAPTEDRAFT_97456 [Capitella teleta]
MSTTCIGCGSEISDRFFMTVLDQAWHTHCVQCADCGEKLIDSCYTREKKLYCKSDFFKRFATQCGVCKRDLSPSDLVRRALDRVYHLQCFTCLVCRRQLDTGEEYFVLDTTRFMCKKDYMEIEGKCGKPSGRAPGSCPACGPGTRPPGAPQDSEDDDATTQVSSAEQDAPESNGGDGTPGSKKSRPRTVIKDDQLKVLHAAFTANHLPTKKEREDLVERTGLSMRVIQVWFQNKRSKERKMQKESGTIPSKDPANKDESTFRKSLVFGV